ncbi:hypothetical protein Tco_0381548 [Tanacetum coccineum]
MKMTFLTEKDALWRMAIKDFYGEDGGLFFSDASHGSSVIGNSSSISFWKDVWCNLGTRVMNSFLRLYGIETNKECNLSDRWRLCNGVWVGVLEWRIPIRGRVADDLCHLVELIGNNSFFL